MIASPATDPETTLPCPPSHLSHAIQAYRPADPGDPRKSKGIARLAATPFRMSSAPSGPKSAAGGLVVGLQRFTLVPLPYGSVSRSMDSPPRCRRMRCQLMQEGHFFDSSQNDAVLHDVGAACL